MNTLRLTRHSLNSFTFGLAAAIALGQTPAYAQAPAGPAAMPPATATSALPVPLPPGAAVHLEVDGRDQDLLGVVKSLLAGATSTGGAGTVRLAFNGLGGALTDEQITALLRNIHHLHLLSFATAGGDTDALAFYEPALTAGGGHRLVFSNAVPRVLMVGFDPPGGLGQPGGFALVVQSPGVVYVVRADGYPDMQLVGRLLAQSAGGVPTGQSTAPTRPKHVPASKAQAH